MKLFKLRGTQPIIRLSLAHPIQLDENKNYMLGLVGFYSDDFISNVSRNTENAFRLSKGKSGYTFPICCNQYSVQDLENRFRECLKVCLDQMTVENRNYKIKDFEVIINPDLKLSIKSPMDSYLSKLLGFGDKPLIVKTNERVSAKKLPKLQPFDVTEIHCNLVELSITNHTSDIHRQEGTEILYSFFPNVDYKQKIREKPNEIHYVPIRKVIKQIKDNIISIQDEKDKFLKNEGANILYSNMKVF